MIELLRKLSNSLPRQTLITRPNLDYGAIVYDQAFDNFFHTKIELIQYNACLPKTGTIRDT